MEHNSTKSVTTTKEKLRCHLFEFIYIIDSLAVVRTQSHLRWGFCFNSKHLTTFCLHGSLPLMFDSLHL